MQLIAREMQLIHEYLPDIHAAVQHLTARPCCGAASDRPLGVTGADPARYFRIGARASPQRRGA